MCCPECEDYIDEDGYCSCSPDEDDDEEYDLEELYLYRLNM